MAAPRRRARESNGGSPQEGTGEQLTQFMTSAAGRFPGIPKRSRARQVSLCELRCGAVRESQENSASRSITEFHWISDKCGGSLPERKGTVRGWTVGSDGGSPQEGAGERWRLPHPRQLIVGSQARRRCSTLGHAILSESCILSDRLNGARCQSGERREAGNLLHKIMHLVPTPLGPAQRCALPKWRATRRNPRTIHSPS